MILACLRKLLQLRYGLGVYQTLHHPAVPTTVPCAFRASLSQDSLLYSRVHCCLAAVSDFPLHLRMQPRQWALEPQRSQQMQIPKGGDDHRRCPKYRYGYGDLMPTDTDPLEFANGEAA